MLYISKIDTINVLQLGDTTINISHQKTDEKGPKTTRTTRRKVTRRRTRKRKKRIVRRSPPRRRKPTYTVSKAEQEIMDLEAFQGGDQPQPDLPEHKDIVKLRKEIEKKKALENKKITKNIKALEDDEKMQRDYVEDEYGLLVWRDKKKESKSGSAPQGLFGTSDEGSIAPNLITRSRPKPKPRRIVRRKQKKRQLRSKKIIRSSKRKTRSKTIDLGSGPEKISIKVQVINPSDNKPLYDILRFKKKCTITDRFRGTLSVYVTGVDITCSQKNINNIEYSIKATIQRSPKTFARMNHQVNIEEIQEEIEEEFENRVIELANNIEEENRFNDHLDELGDIERTTLDPSGDYYQYTKNMTLEEKIKYKNKLRVFEKNKTLLQAFRNLGVDAYNSSLLDKIQFALRDTLEKISIIKEPFEAIKRKINKINAIKTAVRNLADFPCTFVNLLLEIVFDDIPSLFDFSRVFDGFGCELRLFQNRNTYFFDTTERRDFLETEKEHSDIELYLLEKELLVSHIINLVYLNINIENVLSNEEYDHKKNKKEIGKIIDIVQRTGMETSFSNKIIYSLKGFHNEKLQEYSIINLKFKDPIPLVKAVYYYYGDIDNYFLIKKINNFYNNDYIENPIKMVKYQDV